MVPCAIWWESQDTGSKPQSDMCTPDTGHIMEYEFMKHKAKAYLQYNEIIPGAGMHLLLK